MTKKEIEKRVEALDRCELEERAHALEFDVEELTMNLELTEKRRDELVQVMVRFVDAFKAGEDLAPVARAADDMLKLLGFEDGYFSRMPLDQERKLIDKWIDAYGAAPPGVDPALIAYIGDGD